MSVSNEVIRIQAARNAIRNTLLAWGLPVSTDKLDELAAALAALPNRGAMTESLEEDGIFTIPQGFHNGSGTVANAVHAGKMEPYVYDFNIGYVNGPTWVYENPTNTFSDIYRVEAGHSYFIGLGGTVGTRFRAMFTTEDVTEATGNVAGVSIRNANNPAAYANAAYAAEEDGYIIVAKDNVGTSGLKSYVYDRTRRWP